MTGHLCNLVIPGAAKSGTSSLHEVLDRHPEICMSAGKEPHYFCRTDVYARGQDYHNALFHKTGQERIFGESSTGYMIWPEAIARIRRDLANPKIILLLREPVARAFSHYRWRYRLGLEDRSFLRAMQEDGYGYDPMQPADYGYRSYLQFSNYAEYCPLWEQAFGAENVLMITSDQLKRDQVGVQRRCFEFLGVQDGPAAEGVAANRTEDTVSRKPVFGPLSRLTPKWLKQAPLYQRLRGAARRRLTPTPPAAMTREEADYAQAALTADVAWFRDRFG